MSETTSECDACAGCGQIATDEDRTPWKYWADLKPPANLSVTLGFVRPVVCRECGGTGSVRHA